MTEPAEDPGQPEGRQPNGVLVERILNGQGASVNVVLLGDMRITEKVAVLRMALAAAERELASG